MQVQNYLADFGGAARPGATHVICIGGNDIRDALEAGGGQASSDGGATALSAGYNTGLEAVVLGFNSVLSGIHIVLVDLFGTLHDIVDNPGDFGLTNVTDMCITPGVKGDAKCRNPNDYLFWDGIHPTAAGHAIIADLIGPAL